MINPETSAMSAADWRRWWELRTDFADRGLDGESAAEVHLSERARAAECIAVYNDCLSDGDPRKITREGIARLRWNADLLVGSGFDGPFADEQRRFAAALESYLPPEGL